MRPTSSFSAALALALGALVPAPLLATGCSSSESAADTTGPAGAGGAAGAGGSAGQAGDAGAGGEAPAKCDTKGVSKGPWVVATDGTSAKIRWQTCVPGAKDVAITPEGGGFSISFGSELGGGLGGNQVPTYGWEYSNLKVYLERPVD